MPAKCGRSFNRTIVELKFSPIVAIEKACFTFNRTIVELKLAFASLYTCHALSFNRTIVELKFGGEIPFRNFRLF